MANCSNCSAALPPNSIVCEYCGSRNDTDLQGIHHYTTHDTQNDRICPRCNIRMRTINLKTEGRFLIERCDECLGLFFDPGEVEALLDATVTNVFEINRMQLDSINNALHRTEKVVTYVKCPVCSQLMNRVNFGAKSGVVVDKCKEHGVWLDGGELRHLCEWMKAGGKLLHQQQQEETRRREEAAEKERRREIGRQPVGGPYHGDPDPCVFGSNSEMDVIHLVISAARFILKL